MLIFIDEETFTGRPTEATTTAVRLSLLTRELGYTRLLVSPKATEAARHHGLDEGLAQGLDLAQRGWLEGQSLLSRLTRVVSLVDDPRRHGSVRGNIFEVATESAFSMGIFKEPSVVTENIATDGAFLALIFRLWNGTESSALSRFWGVRMDQGGGSTIRNYVRRYVDSPEPMTIVCDRDSAGWPACGDTAKACVDDIVHHGLFDCRESAKAGGFSPSNPHFAFDVLDAWSVESLVLPHLSQLLMNSTMNAVETNQRIEIITGDHPAYPSMQEDGPERWLSTNFKKYNNGSSAWNSNSIQRFIDWTNRSIDNFAEAKAAFDLDYSIPQFRRAIDKTCKLLMAIGVRDQKLM